MSDYEQPEKWVDITTITDTTRVLLNPRTNERKRVPFTDEDLRLDSPKPRR